MRTTELGFAIAIALVSCSEQKEATSPLPQGPPRPFDEQCNDLGKVINTQQAAVRDDIGTLPKKERQEELYAASDRLKKASEAIRGVSIWDPRLAPARDRYAKVYENLSSDANLAAAAKQASDEQRVKDAMMDVPRQIEDERKAISEINTICKPAAAPGASAAPSASAPAAPAAPSAPPPPPK